MLSKLYEKQVDAKIKETRDKRNEEQEKISKELLSAEAGNLLKLADKKKKLLAEAEAITEQLKSLCRGSNFTCDWHDEIEVSYNHPKMVKFNDESRALENKMDSVKTKIMINIWGLTGDYNAICTAIDEEFKKL